MSNNALIVPKQDRSNSDNNEKEDEIDLKALLIAALHSKLTILLLSSIGFIIAFIIAYGQAPIYKANTLLRIESQKATIPGLDDLANLGGSDDVSIATEIELIKARRILSIAIKDLKLNIIAEPKRVPFFSYFHQHLFSPKEVNKLPSIWDTFDQWAYPYAWGNEEIKVDQFKVPNEFINEALTIVSKKDDRFELMMDGNTLLVGKTGKTVQSKNKKMSIFISKLTGKEGTEFSITKLSGLRVRSMLKKMLSATEKGKKTGILNLSLTGKDKELIVKILDKIANTYIEQNKARSSEEASNALRFLEEQIKPIKRKMDQAEAKLKEYLVQNQTADLQQEAEAVLGTAVEIDAELQRLSLQKAELKQKYTDNHPKVKAITAQENKLQANRNRVKNKIVSLPKKQQKRLELKRNINVSNAIYLELLSKTQEFKIARASTVGNVYIVDPAETQEKPIKPNRRPIIAIGIFLGFFLAIMINFLRHLLRNTVENPEKLEEETGIPVYVTVPFSKNVELTSSGFKGKDKKQKNLLASKDISDPAIESLRSLRTSLHFALHEAKNNIVLITGPSPNIGKTFISSNFSAILATTDQKVIVIDADMRKGYLHQIFGLKMAPGLSDVLAKKVELQDAIHTLQIDDKTLDIITRGELPPNPSELLMTDNFDKLLKKLSEEYDLVLIDSPPVHAVTDPSIIGSHAGVVFMVVYSDRHSMKEIEHAVSRLAQTGIETKGFIFNGYIASKNKYSYGYNSYYGDYK